MHRETQLRNSGIQKVSKELSKDLHPVSLDSFPPRLSLFLVLWKLTASTPLQRPMFPAQSHIMLPVQISKPLEVVCALNYEASVLSGLKPGTSHTGQIASVLKVFSF